MSVSSPAAGASVPGTIPVNATAADNVGVAGVQFTLDGANLGAEDTAAPYSVSWNTTTATNGTHTLTRGRPRRRRQHDHLGGRQRHRRQPGARHHPAHGRA